MQQRKTKNEGIANIKKMVELLRAQKLLSPLCTNRSYEKRPWLSGTRFPDLEANWKQNEVSPEAGNGA